MCMVSSISLPSKFQLPIPNVRVIQSTESPICNLESAPRMQAVFSAKCRSKVLRWSPRSFWAKGALHEILRHACWWLMEDQLPFFSYSRWKAGVWCRDQGYTTTSRYCRLRCFAEHLAQKGFLGPILQSGVLTDSVPTFIPRIPCR